MSRNGNQFYSFESLAEDIGKAFRTTDAILDGEVCFVDATGCPQFNELLFRRGEPVFFGFDLVYCNGIDWREQPLICRKERLREVLRGIKCDRITYVNHVSRTGKALFARACEMDLEGIVAKHKLGKYMSGRDQSTWFKIRNRSYSQWDGREELFESRDERQRPGWDVCSRAAAVAD
jgi:bifunctional non-homologous end joining protein LigD